MYEDNTIALESSYISIRTNRAYNQKSPITIPYDRENPSILILCTPNLVDSYAALNETNINIKASRFNFYTSDIYYSDKVGKTKILEKCKDQIKDDFTKNVMINHPNMDFHIPFNLSKLMQYGNNIIFDMGKWMEFFFKNRIVGKSRKTVIEDFFTFLNKRIDTIHIPEKYTQILYVPLDKWVAATKTNLNRTNNKLNDPVSIIFSAVFQKMESVVASLPDNIVLHIVDESRGQLLKVTKDELTKENYPKLKAQLAKFECLSSSDDIMDETEENVEKDVQNSIDIVNTDITAKVPDIISNDNVVINETETTDIPKTQNQSVDTAKAKNNKIKDLSIKKPSINMPDENGERLVIGDEIDSNIEDQISSDFKLDLDPPIFSSFKREKTPEQKKNIERLKKVQEKVIKQIDRKSSLVIDKVDFDNLDSTSSDILKSSFVSFEKSYNEKRLEYDIDSVITKLNDGDTSVFVTGKEVKDTSNNLYVKKTYTYKLEDEDGRKHTLSFDLPVFVENRYMILGGNKKLFQNQFALKPLIKTAPDTVQLCSFYNKIFVTRRGKELNTKTTQLKRLLRKVNDKFYTIRFGNGYSKNKSYRRMLDFDALAKFIYHLQTKDYQIFFDLQALDNKLAALKINTNNIDREKEFIFGIDKRTNTPIHIPYEGTQNVTDFIIENVLNEVDRNSLMKSPEGKGYMFSEASIQEKKIPLVLFLLYANGLTEVLRKSGIKHTWYRSKEVVPKYDHLNQGCIEFADGYLVWEKYPIENSILFNGLQSLPLSEFTIEEMDIKDTYVDLMTLKYEYRNIFVILDMFVEYMIDAKTKEILEALNLPTDLVEILIYGNKLLANNEFMPENDMHNIRIRNNEVLTHLLYKEVTNAYKKFRQTRHKKNPEKINMKKDILLSKISLCNTVEDVSDLNAVLSAEKCRAVTYKGPGGINLEEAFKLEKRAYHPSMIGIAGITTSADAGVGVLRQLTLEPNIVNTLGFLKITDMKDVDKLTSKQLFTPAELLAPPSVMHDDAPRLGMAQKQSKVMMLLDNASPVIIGNKVESVIANHIDNSLAHTAKNDGVVKAIKEDYMILEYDDGTRDAIDISKRMLKNGANGIYIPSKIVSEYKVGQRFKKHDVIAYDPRAFSRNLFDNGVSMNVGALTKIAIYPSCDKFEDSAPITSSLANKLATEVSMEETFVLGKNAYVSNIAKVGDHVTAGDNLITFDESYDDPEINKFFETIRSELKEELIQSNIQKVAAKHSGVISDIKIYTTVPLEELSPTLQELVGSKFAKLEKRNKVLDHYKNKDDLNSYKCGQFISETADVSETKFGVLKGQNVGEGVMISFFITHKDIAKKGDKLTNYSALKGIISDVIEPGLEPFSEYRPEEPIETSIAPGAILARKTPSVLLAMFGNKTMIEFTRQLRDYYLND